ncbi:MAG: cytochrome oxidase [Myxococcales bacterium]|jgi:cbb3-type cytochrome oxidase subunit 3|nr:cytochrome oxidase [Myxococcales bacterium]
MEVIVLQAFVSLMLVLCMLLLFGHMLRKRTPEHADRLALMPLEDDESSQGK